MTASRAHLYQSTTSLQRVSVKNLAKTIVVISSLITAAGLIALFSFQLYRAGFTTAAYIGAAAAFTVIVVYGHKKFSLLQLALPGMVLLGLATVFPILLTVYISTLNLNASTILPFERAELGLLSFQLIDESQGNYTVFGKQHSDELELYFQRDDGQWFSVAALSTAQINNTRQLHPTTEPSAELDPRVAIQHRATLDTLTLIDERGNPFNKASLRTFGAVVPRFQKIAEHVYRNHGNGDKITADFRKGHFIVIESTEETRLGQYQLPNFIASVGLKNYYRVLDLSAQWQVFTKLALWNVSSALISISLSFMLALMVAALLNWRYLPERNVIKFLIVAAYAIPSFAVISAFRDLYLNSSFATHGLLSLISSAFANISVETLQAPLQRLYFIALQTWLLTPLIFILCLGALPKIPKDIYEAAALDGANTVRRFLNITLPFVFKMLAPILIILFALAFNDLNTLKQFGLGVPIPGTVPAVYPLDFLVSFADRLAFDPEGNHQYSLGAAFFSLLFTLLSILAFILLKVLNRQTGDRA